MTDKPLCECHGVPSSWNKDGRYLAGGYWRCAVTHRENMRRLYDRLSGFEYNRMLLRHRHTKALARMKQRKEAIG